MSSTLGASLLRTVLSDGTLKILGSGLDKGPIIYITLIRMQEAKKLLVYSQLSVNKISKSLGYTRTSYFCKIFKLTTQETPYSYRQKYAPPENKRVANTSENTLV